MNLFQKIILGVCALCLIVPAVAHAVVINEIRIDNTGGDTDEYFELAGTPGQSLDGYTYIVIGDGTTTLSGTIENVTDLSGQTIQADGYLAVHKSGTTGNCTGYDVDLTLNFENSDNVTHMLVTGFSGANGDDLDTDDDGVLDSTPWTSIEDCVALVEDLAGQGTTQEYVYCTTTVGPDGNYVPGHVFLCGNDWKIGPFGSGAPCSGDTLDTPGADNSPSCAIPSEETSWGAMKSRF